MKDRHVAVALIALLAAGACALLVVAWRCDLSWFEVHALRLRCATAPSQVRVSALLRLVAAGSGVALLAALRPIYRRVARAGFPWGLVLRIGMAVVLALVVSELVLRHAMSLGVVPLPKHGLPPARDDPRLGWVLDGPRTFHIVDDGRSVEYTTDAGGDRVRSEGDLPDPDSPTVLFVGESITFGLGLLWDETYPAIVGKRLGLQVVNTGVHGYGDGQMAWHALERLAWLRRPVAVVTLVITDQVTRNMDSWYDRVGLGADGSLVVVPKPPSWWRKSPLLATLHHLTASEGEESIRLSGAFHDVIDRAARARGAYSLFVLTNLGAPCLPDASGRPSIDGRLFDEGGIDHVRVDLDPTWVVHTNWHPDARAHARLADAITEALRPRVFAGPSPSDR
jgi:hypothetical protein